MSYYKDCILSCPQIIIFACIKYFNNKFFDELKRRSRPYSLSIIHEILILPFFLYIFTTSFALHFSNNLLTLMQMLRPCARRCMRVLCFVILQQKLRSRRNDHFIYTDEARQAARHWDLISVFDTGISLILPRILAYDFTFKLPAKARFSTVFINCRIIKSISGSRISRSPFRESSFAKYSGNSSSIQLRMNF